MKKILVLHNSYKQYGGEDAAVEDEISLLKKEYEVDYLNFKNDNPNSIQEINGLFFNFNNESTKKILTKVNLFKPDYLYIHNSWYKISLSIFEISKRMNIPLVLKIHNFRYDCANSLHYRNGNACHDCTPQNRNPGIINRCYDNSFIKSFIITNYSKNYFDKIKNFDFKILLLNHFHYEYMKNLGIGKEKIHVIPNPINDEDLNVVKKNDEHKTAIYAGRLSEEKGVAQELGYIEIQHIALRKALHDTEKGSEDNANQATPDYFLVKVDLIPYWEDEGNEPSIEVLTFSNNQHIAATEKYGEWEEDTHSNPLCFVLLAKSENLEAFQQGFPNYFADIREFKELHQRYVS